MRISAGGDRDPHAARRCPRSTAGQVRGGHRRRIL